MVIFDASMSSLYKVKPKNLKSISLVREIVEKLPDNKLRSFKINERYKDGQGFRPVSNGQIYLDDYELSFDPNCGFGSNLNELCFVSFSFDKSFSEDTKKKYQEQWFLYREAWLASTSNTFSIHNTQIIIFSPFIVDIVDDITGSVITEYVNLQYRPRFNNTTSWPYGDD